MSTGGDVELDVIRLTGLGGAGRHGVLPEERRDGQVFKVDLTMSVDTRAAAEHDDLELTVDYAAVAAQVVQIVEGEPVNLIETLAARIAAAVLAFEQVRRVEVTVHKPEAPVGVPFTDVEVVLVRSAAASTVDPAPVAAAAPAASLPAAVAPAGADAVEEDVPSVAVPEPERAPERAADLDAEPAEPVEVVLALGGNVGDARTTLRAAIDDLSSSDLLDVVGIAPLAKTAAVLQPDAVAQPDFLNTVVIARTSASPRAVLELAHEIEAVHGRTRGQRWGERTLDIDVIAYGSVSSSDPELSLPHPRANERAFVLVPWAHLDPDAFLPGLGGGPVAALADTAPDRSGVRWLALDWYEQPARPQQPAAAPPAPFEQLATSRVRSAAEEAPVVAPAASVEAVPEEEPPPPVRPEPHAWIAPEVPGDAPSPASPEPSTPEPAPAPVTPAPVTPEPAPEPPSPTSAPVTQDPVPEPSAPEPAVEPSTPEPATWAPVPEHAPYQPPVDDPPAPAPIEPDGHDQPASPEPDGRASSASAPSEDRGPVAGEPWEVEQQSSTRIRPRWEPLHRDDGDD